MLSQTSVNVTVDRPVNLTGPRFGRLAKPHRAPYELNSPPESSVAVDIVYGDLHKMPVVHNLGLQHSSEHIKKGRPYKSSLLPET
jgi:hypothetical protein